jgi:anti-anti-sigma factor
MERSPSDGAFDVTRIPGEAGPILLCRGELTAATVPVLQKELDALLSLGHPALVLKVTECSYIDVDGLLAILLAFKSLRERGGTLALAAGTGSVARLLRVLGIDWVLPVFPSEEVAMRALRGGGPVPAPPGSWKEAKERSLARWRAILDAIEREPTEAVGRQLTAMTALCDRAEAIFETDPDADVRCRFCPLFHALGGRPEDVGCRSVLDPMLAAVLHGDTVSAREQVAALIRTLEQMPAEEEGSDAR